MGEAAQKRFEAALRQAVAHAQTEGLSLGEAVMVLSDLADELRGGADPLGYDTSKPILELAKEMADDVLSGRTRVAVEEELARVPRHLWPGLERRWVILSPDGRHGNLKRYMGPEEPEAAQVEARLRELSTTGWLAVLRGDYHDPTCRLELGVVRRLGEPTDVEWETAVDRFLAIPAATLREGRS